VILGTVFGKTVNGGFPALPGSAYLEAVIPTRRSFVGKIGAAISPLATLAQTPRAKILMRGSDACKPTEKREAQMVSKPTETVEKGSRGISVVDDR
jgi:hypothetical protein